LSASVQAFRWPKLVRRNLSPSIRCVTEKLERRRTKQRRWERWIVAFVLPINRTSPLIGEGRNCPCFDLPDIQAPLLVSLDVNPWRRRTFIDVLILLRGQKWNVAV
jgi:hypothetical protein